MGAITNALPFLPGEVNQYGASLPGTAMGSLNDRRGLSATPLTGFGGTMVLTYYRASKTVTTTNLGMYSGTTAAGATPTLVRFGLYAVAANGDLTLLSGTANDTTIFSTVNTLYSRPLGAAQQETKGLWYARALLVVSAAAMPSVLGVGTATVSSGLVMAEAPRLTGNLGGQADLPASVPAGTVTPGVFALWVESS